ncbi:MAG TPA: DUF6600 domain-containing protein [Bryobacteraceae bacterium]|nr:DUF6600 domain-containing protein [Bryobacteraceae bacterium]
MKLSHASLVLLIAGSIVFAQDPGPQAAVPPDNGQQAQAVDDNQPGRGIARISLLNGDVSVRRGDSGDVTAAAINAPLGPQDGLLTSSTARAELQFDAANSVRIAPNSEVQMGDLQYNVHIVQVAIGTVTYTVLNDSQAQSEIDTPNVAVRPLQRGAYRITVREDGTSEIVVRSGEAEVATQRGSEHVRAGQMMMVRGNPPDVEFQVVAAPALDEWDSWNQSRDRQVTSSRSAQNVNPNIYGTEDLDQNGRWQYDSTYNQNVWVPSVGPDWAPYRDGRWVWEDWYGWTWVGAEPWGWAPYHFGRWYHAGFGWAWWPGPVVGPCYWRPALVGFFGFGGGGFGVGFGFGNVGWVPLAPFEPLHPWWGRWGGYGRNVFVNNTTIINHGNIGNVYRNARFGNSITAVSAGNFGRRAGGFNAMSANQVGSAGVVRGMLPVAPDRSSLRMSDRAVNMSRMPQVRNQQFFSRMPQSQAQHIPFEQQQRMVQQAGRNAFTGSSGAVTNPGGFSRAGGSSSPVQSPGGWRQSSDRPSSSGGTPPSGVNHGWSRFGEPIHNSGGASQQSSFAGRQGGYAPQANYRSEQSNSGSPSGGRYSAPASQGNGWGSGGSGAVRISPPIVRERPSTPQNYGGGAMSSPRSFGGSGGGGGRAATPAPAPRSYSGGGGSAPRGGGGGGGGSHGGGGGGGSHSSGGGGGHHR